MKAGRELDAKIAEEVMGWEYQQNAPSGHFCKTVGNDRGWWRNPKYKDWTCAQCCEVPPEYSTNIARAYPVAVKAGLNHILILDSEQETATWVCNEALKKIEP